MPLNRTLRRLLGAVPGIRQLRRELSATRGTAAEALRLATESARAVESLLQSELELKRELAALRATDAGTARAERVR
ncbi:hypothetical protein GCM10027290_25210 [Micromonospora sonneratiae]|uniref:Uncharacterized protein n=1 Tax=Micromonospora sonneratiae TaxID=1184706 RepID=A0ABW3YJR4_9ACTN